MAHVPVTRPVASRTVRGRTTADCRPPLRATTSTHARLHVSRFTPPVSRFTRPWLLALALLLLTALAWGLAPAPASASHPGNVIFVDRDAMGGNNGSSWGDAYTSLQAALAHATSGTELWVATGVYTPGLTASDTFQLKNGVAIYGGFAATETLLAERDWTANVTVLSGDIAGDDTTDANGVVTDIDNINGTNSMHVVTGSGTSGTARLDGFTITAGQAYGTVPHDLGGGMFNFNSSPTLANVTFSANSARLSGGGMFNADSSPTLANVTFSANSAGSGEGGGMFNFSNSSPTLANVTFSANSARQGGGMFNLGSSPRLANVTFGANSASLSGGGMVNTNSSPTLANVTFSANSAGSGEGGGMFNVNSSPTVRNSILWGNSGGQIGNSGASPTVEYSIVEGSSVYPGTGNTNANPRFVDANGADNQAGTADDDLRLRWSSPAIDAGNNGAVPNDTLDLDHDGIVTETLPVDLDLNPRFVDHPRPDTAQGDIVDMGAYETPALTPQPDLRLSKSDGGISAQPGETISYTLTVSNTGNRLATGLTLTESVPGNTTFDAGASSPGWSCADGSGAGTTCTRAIGELAAGDDGHFTFAVTVANPVAAGASEIDNTASVADDGTNGADPTPGDNSGSDSTPLVTNSDLSIEKSASLTSALPGQPVTYTLVYSHTGDIVASGVTITDRVPVELVDVDHDSSGATITDTGSTPPYVWEVEDLAPGEGGIITITGRISPFLSADTVFTNTATIGGSGQETTLANNAGDATLSVVVPRVAFEAAGYVVDETDGSATISVTLDTPNPYADVTVFYQSDDGSAEAGSDYTSVSGTLTIPAGQTLATFSVPVNDDAQDEPDETVELALSDAVGAALGTPSEATLTIRGPDLQVDDKAFGVRFDGWVRISDTLASGGGMMAGFGRYERIGYRAPIHTRSITLIGYRGPDQGKARIIVDGVVKGTYDFYSPSPQYGYELPFTGLARRRHTIEVVVLNEKRAASKGRQVRVDAFRAGTAAFAEEDDLLVRYNGWSAANDGKDFGGSKRLTRTNGDAVFFYVQGDSFTWITDRGPNRGWAQIFVDRVANQQVNLYNAAPESQHLVQVSGLGPGTHLVKISALGLKGIDGGDRWVAFDGFTAP